MLRFGVPGVQHGAKTEAGGRSHEIDMTARTWSTMELVRTTTEYFEGKGLPAARLAAERLLAHAWGCRRVDLYMRTETVLDARVVDAYRELVRAYASGQPLQYVMGETEFFGLLLATDRRALIPRPETELLVDLVAKRLRPQAGGAPAAVLELGTGSGAIAIALAVQLPHVEVWATDASADAAALATANARRHGVESRVHVLVMDRFEALSPDLSGTMTCVIANPPYVTTAEMAALPAVVRDHEPHRALHGGDDGLDFHRYLCRQGAAFLAPGGLLAVEIGASQGVAVSALCREAGLLDVAVAQDWAGFDRIVLGTR
jgi:release factor glutamine methyltransferase